MINFTPSSKSPKWIGYVQIWLPSFFSLFLCGIVVATYMQFLSLDVIDADGSKISSGLIA